MGRKNPETQLQRNRERGEEVRKVSRTVGRDIKRNGGKRGSKAKQQFFLSPLYTKCRGPKLAKRILLPH